MALLRFWFDFLCFFEPRSSAQGLFESHARVRSDVRSLNECKTNPCGKTGWFECTLACTTGFLFQHHRLQQFYGDHFLTKQTTLWTFDGHTAPWRRAVATTSVTVHRLNFVTTGVTHRSGRREIWAWTPTTGDLDMCPWIDTAMVCG